MRILHEYCWQYLNEVSFYVLILDGADSNLNKNVALFDL